MKAEAVNTRGEPVNTKEILIKQQTRTRGKTHQTNDLQIQIPQSDELR